MKRKGHFLVCKSRARVLEDAVGVVLVVVVEPGGERVQRVAHEAVDERLQLRLGAAEVEARAERRHRPRAAQARQLPACNTRTVTAALTRATTTPPH